MHWDYSKGNPPPPVASHVGPTPLPPDPDKTHKCNEIIVSGPKTGEVCDKWFKKPGDLTDHHKSKIHVEDYNKYVRLRRHLEFKAESHVTLSKCKRCGKTFKKVRPFLSLN
jgi:hypothetical protein